MIDEYNSSMVGGAISHAADMIRISWQEAAWEQMRPSVLYKPILSKDGDTWCALLGDNLQVGVAGFGPTPAKALYAFDTAFNNEEGSHIIGTPDETE